MSDQELYYSNSTKDSVKKSEKNINIIDELKDLKHLIKNINSHIESIESNQIFLSDAHGIFYSCKDQQIKPDKYFIFDKEIVSKNIKLLKNNKIKIDKSGIYCIDWSCTDNCTDDNIVLQINNEQDMMTLSSSHFNHIIKLDFC